MFICTELCCSIFGGNGVADILSLAFRHQITRRFLLSSMFRLFDELINNEDSDLTKC